MWYSISPGLCKKNFDHKSTFLQLGSVKKVGRKAVNNGIIGNPLFRLIVILAIYETYKSQIECAKNGIVDIMLMNLCGSLDAIAPQFAVLLTFCDSWAWKPLSPTDRDIRDESLQIISNTLDNIVQIAELSNLPKKLDDDEFFELLVANINKGVLDLQFKSIKSEKQKIKQITDELGRL